MEQSGRRKKRPIGRPKTALLVAQRIIDEIVDGGLSPGDTLLPEHEMCAEYEVGRGTMREAIRFLEFQGIVHMKTGPGGGPIVGGAGAESLRSILAMFLQLHGATYRSLLEARIALDPMLASAAARQITDEQLDALERTVSSAEKVMDDYTGFQRHSDDFHKLITQATGNPIFTVVVDALDWIPVAEELGIEFGLDTEATAHAQHADILKALRARDGRQAAELMEAHMQALLQFASERHPEVLDRPIRWDIMR